MAYKISGYYIKQIQQTPIKSIFYLCMQIYFLLFTKARKFEIISLLHYCVILDLFLKIYCNNYYFIIYEYALIYNNK